MPGNGSKRWQWSEHLLLPALGAAARASWQWPVAYLVLNSAVVTPGAALPAWLLIALLLLPGLLAQLLAGRRRARGVVGLAGVVAVLLATWAITQTTLGGVVQQFALLGAGLDNLARLPAVVPALLFAFACWLQGSKANWLRYATAWHSTLAGALTLALLAVLAAARGKSEPTLALAMAAFLVSSLLSLALLAVRGTLALEQIRHNRRLGVSRYWLGAMIVLIVLLLLAGWGLASATDPSLVRAIVHGLAAAARWVGHILAAGLAWIAYGVFWLLDPLIRWLQGQQAVSPDMTAAEQLGEQMRQLAEGQAGAQGAPLWWERLMTLLGSGVLAAVALWLLLRAVGRPRGALAVGEEERESIFTLALLQAQLRSLLGRGRQKSVAPYLPITGDDAVAVVRRAYQRLLATLQETQGARPPGQTPHHLALLLAQRQPAAADDIARLTAAYVRARYGDAPDSATAQAAALAAERLVALLRADER